MSGRFTVEAMFKAFDGVSGVVSRMQRRLDGFGKATERVSKGIGSVDRVNGRIMAGAAAFGAATAAGAVVAGAALKNVVDAGASFEHTLVGAAAKFDPAIRRGSAAFTELKKAALDVGSASEFGATKAAQALDSLAAAGLKPKQAIALLPGVIDFATASTTDLGEAADIATKSLGAFNLVTDDAAQLTANLNRVSDTMAMTANITNANMGALFETIKEGGPIATTAGQSVETFLSLAGQLANAGIEGTVAGTTLKNAFLTLAAPTKEASAALATLGIKTRDAKGNMVDALDVLAALQEKTAKLGTAERAGTLEQIFGKIPLAGVAALLSGGIDKTRALRAQLEKAGGSVKTVAGIMRDDQKGAIDKLSAAFEGLKLSIADVVQGPLEPLIKRFAEWGNANKDLIATRIQDFIADATPIIREFGVGLAEGARQVKGFASGVASVIGPIDELFGSSASQRIRNAHELGEFVVKAGAAFVGFSLATKLAGGTLVAFEAVTKGVRATIWLFEAAVSGAKSAMVLYQIWTKAGTAATLAMSFPLVATTVDFVAQAAASGAAAIGLRGVGAAALGARFGLTGMGAAVTGALGPIGLLLSAVFLLKSALEELDRVAGGFGAVWAGVKSALKADEVDAMGNAVSSGGFFKGMDEFRNQQARATAARGDQAAALAGGPGAAFDSAFMSGEIAKQMAQFEEQLKKVNALSLGDDMPVQRPGDGSRPDPQVAGPAERGAARVERTVTEMRDKLEITVKAGENTEAEVTKKPTRAGVKVEASGAD